MITRFRYRAVVPACSLCVAGLLAFTPALAGAAPAAARHRSAALPRNGEPAPPAPRAATPAPALLYRSGTQVRPRRNAPELPDVSALSWLVADAGSGQVLAASEAHRPLPPASTLKTLFALTVLPKLPSGMQHTVRYQELADVAEGSSLVGVEEGHSYRVADLWRGSSSAPATTRCMCWHPSTAAGRPPPSGCRPTPAPWAPWTPMCSPRTATTPPVRCPPPTTSPCSAARACATPTSPRTAPPRRPSSPATGRRSPSRTPTGCSPAPTAWRPTRA